MIATPCATTSLSPSTSASKGSGNIYFQISAPTSYQWVALGTGSRMRDSNMFIMYQDGKGNVTVSPRKGTNQTPPQLDTSSTAARLTVLAGSGVQDGKIIANVRCSNCESWSGGTISLMGTGTNWIAAWKQGSSLATTDKSQQITQHDAHDTFVLDLTKATVSTDANPFVSAQAGGSGDDDTGNDNPLSDNNGAGVVRLAQPSARILAAHAIIMAVVMAILYPLGSLLMPLLGTWWLHAVWQIVTFCLMWAAFALGVKAAKDRDELFQQSHTILGTVVVCLMVIQPALGFLHHRHFVSAGGRGPVSYAHIWFGRSLLVLGVVNGGLGLQLSKERRSLIIAYSVVTAIIFLAYALVKVWSTTRGKKSLAGVGGKETGSPLRGNEPVRYA
ncbi:hypothetical protein B0H63DRAFT_22343 [Podospora didyma]|uniref:DOMON domain-containing protein n=1 Tax=Podospora didyma TaxID=330526 RepID=A0AAE0P619_9PEZI|nr:hypothetical protein B0H63DRAFT_22343 [Podospora didyma]